MARSLMTPLFVLAYLNGCAAASDFGRPGHEAAGLTERDHLAIARLEQRVVALPRARTREPAPLEARMLEMKVPAVSVAFIENGKVKWARAYGEKVAGSGQAVLPETKFQAGSLSKAVAAAGALRLLEQGQLSLDDDVNVRLRSWKVPPRAGGASSEIVTLRRLLSHTAGLTVSGYRGYSMGEAIPSVVDSLRGAKPANSPAVRPFAAPGSKTAYSGGGYTAAQLLMTDISGTSFQRLMERTVLRPVGMARSTFKQPLPREEAAKAASGHDGEGKPIPGGSNTYPELAAAGLWTTPSDYGRFLIALQHSWAGRPGALLKWQNARAMMTADAGGSGLGVMIMGGRGGRRIITHGGTNEGFQSRFMAFLDGSRAGLVIMTNGDNGGALAAAVQRTVAEAYGFDDALGPPPPRAPDS